MLVSANRFINIKKVTLIRDTLCLPNEQPTFRDNSSDVAPSVDLDIIKQKVEEELMKAKRGEQTELDKSFMNFQMKREVNC